MISKQLQQWLDAAAAKQLSVSEVKSLLRKRGYTDSVVSEAEKYYDANIVPEKKSVTFNFSYSIGFIVLFSGVLALLVPDTIPFLILVSYAAVLGFTIAVFLSSIFSLAGESLSAPFVMVFSILFISKIVSFVFEANIIGSLIILLLISFGILLIFEKGDISKASTSVVFIGLGVFILDLVIIYVLNIFVPSVFLTLI